MASSEFAVANSDLQKIQPDILGFGVTDFGDQLQFAENDVLQTESDSILDFSETNPFGMP